MSGYRLFKIVILVLVILVIGLGLNYHKELIQYFNINTLVSEGLDGRLIPHRINRIDKLLAVLDSGIRSFEVDLLFRSNGRRGFFEVGHDEADAIGVKVDLFLNNLRTYEVKKIWLDIRYVCEENVDAVIAELERLDSLYGIRKTAIIESTITTSGFQKISSRGFHTSYYLPTDRIVNLLIENDESTLKAEANRLRQQIESQSVSAISFSLALYPFVKSYLEPIIPDTIVYHTWGSIKLWEWNAIDELKDIDYFKDARVKTILTGYWGSGCISSLRFDAFR
jgi:hypothetical protein